MFFPEQKRNRASAARRCFFGGRMSPKVVGAALAVVGGFASVAPASAVTVSPSFGVVATYVAAPWGSTEPSQDKFTGGAIENLSTSASNSVNLPLHSFAYTAAVDAAWVDATVGSVSFLDIALTGILGGAGGFLEAGGAWGYIFSIDSAELVTFDYLTSGTGVYGSTPELELLIANDENWADLLRVRVSGPGSVSLQLPGAGRYQLGAFLTGPGTFKPPGTYAGSQAASLSWRIGEAPASAAPEAATWTLMIAGFGGVGASIRRRRTEVA